MKTLYLTGPVSLSMVTAGLKVRRGDESTVTAPPYLPYDTVILKDAFGYVSWAALRILLSMHVSVAMLDYQGRLLGHMAPPGSSDVGMKQLEAAANPKKRLAVARAILIRGYRRRGLNPPFQAAKNVRELMDIESKAAESYWVQWKAKLDRVWPENDFDGRTNPRYNARYRAVSRVNAVLNYSYALLESACRTMCHRVGLNPRVGFLHAQTTAWKEPLVYDLEELGRGWIDRAVLEWFSKPDNCKGYKRLGDWVVRLPPNRTNHLIQHVSPRIRTESLWHDARDIVNLL